MSWMLKPHTFCATVYLPPPPHGEQRIKVPLSALQRVAEGDEKGEGGGGTHTRGKRGRQRRRDAVRCGGEEDDPACRGLATQPCACQSHRARDALLLLRVVAAVELERVVRAERHLDDRCDDAGARALCCVVLCAWFVCL
jgi:hypothetical protein